MHIWNDWYYIVESQDTTSKNTLRLNIQVKKGTFVTSISSHPGVNLNKFQT